jgi:thiamine kinase-like enzyme
VRFAVEQLGEQLPESSHRLAEVYLYRADRVVDLLAEGPRTLVHGDAHLGNMFVDGTTPGFLDWALASYAPGLRDVAYFLGNSVPTELRRMQERQLVASYCQRLQDGRIDLDVDLGVELSSLRPWGPRCSRPRWAWPQSSAPTRRSRITPSQTY